MVMTEYERQLIVKAVGKERAREAAEAHQRRQALEQLPRPVRRPRWSAVRFSIGLMLMRTGARLAGISPGLVLERKRPGAGATR